VNGILTPEVLVLGGTGAVGQGVVGALLEAGSPVLVVGRDPGRLAALHEQFADEPGLQTMLGSLSDDSSARALAERVAPAGSGGCRDGRPVQPWPRGRAWR